MSEKPKQYTSSRRQWAKPKDAAREMRHDPTPAEEMLWGRLRNRGVKGAKFRRQHVISGFVVDFVCIEQLLIVEVDGAVHDGEDQRLYDMERQALLEGLGCRVLRFTNDEVIHRLDSVTSGISEALM